MRTYPGIISRITADGIWIRPRTGGLVQGPLLDGFQRGDKVQYLVNGAGNRVLDVALRENASTLNPLPSGKKEEIIYGWIHEFDWENFIPPIWPID